MDRPETLSFSRRNLPHWRVRGRAYFVTFRLKDTLPKPVLLKLHDLRVKLELIREEEHEKRLDVHRTMFQILEHELDRGNPAIDYLRQPDIAQLVVDALSFAEKEWGWRIGAYVVMPNHVHALFANQEEARRSLTKTLASIKSYTARKANEALSRSGPFWQKESFDHWCRDIDKEQSVIRYIRNNPVKAGLVTNWQDWPWVK